MAKLTKDELIEAFKEMTLIELSEFVKEFEEVFDVEAAAPVAVAAAGAPAAGGAAEEEDRVRRRSDRRWRKEDRRHQGCSRDRFRPGPEGS